jgi:hypothetical protein
LQAVAGTQDSRFFLFQHCGTRQTDSFLTCVCVVSCCAVPSCAGSSPCACATA